MFRCGISFEVCGRCQVWMLYTFDYWRLLWSFFYWLLNHILSFFWLRILGGIIVIKCFTSWFRIEAFKIDIFINSWFRFHPLRFVRNSFNMIWHIIIISSYLFIGYRIEIFIWCHIILITNRHRLPLSWRYWVWTACIPPWDWWLLIILFPLNILLRRSIINMIIRKPLNLGEALGNWDPRHVFALFPLEILFLPYCQFLWILQVLVVRGNVVKV